MECHEGCERCSSVQMFVGSAQDMHLAFRKRGDFSNAIKAATLGLRHAAGLMWFVGTKGVISGGEDEKAFAMFWS